MESRHRILIVGAGIAGLTLANALLQRGISFRVIEKAGTLRPHGLGLGVQPTGVRALRRLGLDDSLRRRGVVCSERLTMDAAENVIARTPNEMLGVNRTALIDTLTGVLPEGCVELNQCVRSLDDSGDDVGVQLDDGSADRFTLVVGADGLHSQIGELLFGSQALAYRGYRAWRTVVQRPLETPAQVVFRHREGVAVGTYPISDQQFYVFALEHGPDDLSANSEPWRHLQRILQTMGPQANGLAGRLSRAVPVIYTPIYEVVRERWHRGRVVLIGDAAHAVTPNGAQGAAMAMEDAVVLAECLANPNDTPEALSEFEARRLPRLQTVRDIVRFGGMSQGLEGRLPDEAMERHPGNVPNAQQVIIQGAL